MDPINPSIGRKPTVLRKPTPQQAVNDADYQNYAFARILNATGGTYEEYKASKIAKPAPDAAAAPPSPPPPAQPREMRRPVHNGPTRPLEHGGEPLPEMGYVNPDISNPQNRKWRTDDEARANPYDLSRCDPRSFSRQPQQPEILFRDAIGVEIPGVSQTRACGSQTEHEIGRWNYALWPEYTTTLAEHGITYEDYTRIKAGVIEISQRAPNEFDSHYAKKMGAFNVVLPVIACVDLMNREGEGLKGKFNKGGLGAARDIKYFLYDVSENLRLRGLPVSIKFKDRADGLSANMSPNARSSALDGYDIVVRHLPLATELRKKSKFWI